MSLPEWGRRAIRRSIVEVKYPNVPRKVLGYLAKFFFVIIALLCTTAMSIKDELLQMTSIVDSICNFILSIPYLVQGDHILEDYFDWRFIRHKKNICLSYRSSDTKISKYKFQIYKQFSNWSKGMTTSYSIGTLFHNLINACFMVYCSHKSWLLTL